MRDCTGVSGSRSSVGRGLIRHLQQLQGGERTARGRLSRCLGNARLAIWASVSRQRSTAAAPPCWREGGTATRRKDLAVLIGGLNRRLSRAPQPGAVYARAVRSGGRHDRRCLTWAVWRLSSRRLFRRRAASITRRRPRRCRSSTRKTPAGSCLGPDRRSGPGSLIPTLPPAQRHQRRQRAASPAASRRWLGRGEQPGPPGRAHQAG